MTYYEEGEVVPELRLRLAEEPHGEKGDYVITGQQHLGGFEAEDLPPSPRRRWRGSVWYWVKLALLFSCLGLLAGVFLKWVWPFFMDKVGIWRFKLFRSSSFC